MPAGDIETYHDDDGRWKNRVVGSTRAANTHDTKVAAATEGRAMAQDRKVEHIVKNQDGTIGERKSYRSDPRSSTG